jgi:hypothetical protein
MAADHPLDAIIQRATSRYKPDKRSESEVLVIVDCKKKEALDRKPMWGDVKYFLVRNTLDGQDPAECEPQLISKKDIDGDRTVTVKLKCWVSCSPGKEKRLAVALCDPNDRPSVVFERLLRRWVDEFVEDEGGSADFMDGYFAEPKDGETRYTRERLQERLQSKALSEAGLNLQVKVRLEDEGNIHKAVDGSTGKFLVSVNGYSERQELEVNCELELDEQRKINAVVHHKKSAQLSVKVSEVTKKFFAHHVSLDQFHGGLNSRGLLDGLTDKLNDALAAEGRIVGRIFLKSDAVGKKGNDDDKAPLQFGPHTVGVPVSVQEYPEKVVIGNKLLLSRRSLSLYKDNNSPKLDEWVEGKLKRIIPDVLFDAKYIDLLLDFDDRKADIEERLRAETEVIGYTVKQLITVPDLKPLKWLDPFQIKIDSYFETRRPKFYVKLSIVIAARFQTLDEPKIRDPLNRQQDVPKLMHDDAFQMASQYLHGIEPEQFYTCFYFKNETKYPGENPVETALRNIIKDMLEGKFGAEVIEVIPKMDDTDVILNLMVLQEKPCDFSVSVTPLVGGAPIIFKGKFRVEEVDSDGWHTFLSRKFGIEDVRQHLEDDVRARLKTMDGKELLYKEKNDRELIQSVISKWAADEIREMFGLVIKVGTIDRELTMVEDGMRLEFIERDMAAVRGTAHARQIEEAADVYIRQKRLEGVKAHADELPRLGADAPDEQIAEQERRLKDERDKLKPDFITPLENVERVLRPGLPGAGAAEQVKPVELTGAASEPPDAGNGRNEEQV